MRFGREFRFPPYFRKRSNVCGEAGVHVLECTTELSGQRRAFGPARATAT